MRPEKHAIRNLAKNLREYRLLRGFSQEELAYQTDTDRTYISDIERGLRNPSLKTIAKLAHALDVPIGALCDPDRS